jgi:hypothetical protein
MFLDRLQTILTLTISGTDHTIIARHIERFDATLEPWGYEAEVSFLVLCVSSPDEDTLFTPFFSTEAIAVAFTIGRAFDEVSEEAEAIVLKGLVTERAVEETVSEDVAGAPIFRRRYTIRFADRGQVLWGQHRPTSLYVDSTYQALCADNLPAGVTLTHSWAPASTQRPVLALGLGVDGNAASFHDFLFWLLDREGAGLFYDLAADSYKIADAKPAGGTAAPLELEEVAALTVEFPPLRRGKVVVLNAWTEAAQPKTEGTNAQAITGVRSDVLVRTPISAAQTARSTQEAARARQKMARARVEFGVFPAVPLAPGKPVTLAAEFSANLFVHGKSFRVGRAAIAGHTVGDEGGADAMTSTRYELRYEVELEQTSDPVFRAPAFVTPRWPFHVEGKVVSEAGEDPELTYQFYPDSATSLDYYKVAIPLYDSKQVIVLFEPIMQSGHFYFPAYKRERVLVALTFDQARFAGYLDWRPGARLPLDTQGNHILFGKKPESETSLRHVYEEAKPILAIKRTNTKDEQTIRVYEGTIRMETLEND